MGGDKLTVQDVADRVEIEGLDYAIQSYFGRDVGSEDEKLNELWRQAYDTLKLLQDYLPHTNY